MLRDAMEQNVSDIFVVPGLPLSFKQGGHIDPEPMEVMTPKDTEVFLSEIYALAGHRSMDRLMNTGDDDFSFSLVGVSRFRVNAYKQRGSLAAVIRVVTFDLPQPEDLGLPELLLKLADRKKGMVLVTGPAGSGKSTTLACIIDRINNTRNAHVITLEDPIEYLHRHKKSIVSQREISTDTESYVTALRASLRQAPDVILLGELRDHETIATAMTAAETGHLVIATLHTKGAVNTIDRIVDAFPSQQQSQVRTQLSMVLRAVISQQLLPGQEGGLVPAFELMTMNSAIRSMIRECKTYQVDNELRTSGAEGMLAMDQSILNLYRSGKITRETALDYADNPDQMRRKMQ